MSAAYDQKKIDALASELMEPQRLAGGGAIRKAARAIGQEALPGAPTTANVPNVGEVQLGKNREAEEAARRASAMSGVPYRPTTRFAPLDVDRATRIAREYDLMKHDPDDPLVKLAYEQMIKETNDQYEAMLQAGIEPYFIEPGSNTYRNSPYEVLLDVAENRRLGVFPSVEGFGTDPNFNPQGNPLLQETGRLISGRPALANDLFRAVHDYFGHAKPGVGFRAAGEENAYQSHAGMFSPLARRALASETRGQNSYLNYGPYGETNRTARIEDTRFADQKAGLMPRWASEAGLVINDDRRREFFDNLARNQTGLEGAISDDGKLRLVHYSSRPLERIDPAFYGRGLSRASLAERNRSYDPEFVKRSYYGIPASEKPYVPEFGLGGIRNEVLIEPELIYQAQANPEGLWLRNDPTGSERRIAEAGYTGYYTTDPKLGKVAVIFDPYDVSKSYMIPVGAVGAGAMAMSGEEEPETMAKGGLVDKLRSAASSVKEAGNVYKAVVGNMFSPFEPTEPQLGDPNDYEFPELRLRRPGIVNLALGMPNMPADMRYLFGDIKDAVIGDEVPDEEWRTFDIATEAQGRYEDDMDAFLRSYTGKSVDELSGPMSAVLGVSEALAQPGIISAKAVEKLPRLARYLSNITEFATPVTVASPGAMMTGAGFNAGIRVLPALTDGDDLEQMNARYSGRELSGEDQARLDSYLQELLGKNYEMAEPELLAGGGAIRKAAEAVDAANKSTSNRPVNEQLGIDRAKSFVEESGYRWNDVKQITTPEEYLQFQRQYGLASAVSERDDPTDVFHKGGAMFYDQETGAPVAYAPSGSQRKKAEGMADGGLIDRINQGFYENISKPAVGTAIDMTLGLGDLAQMAARYLGNKAGFDAGEFTSVAQPVKEAIGVDDYNPYTIGGVGASILPFAAAGRTAQAINAAPAGVRQIQAALPNLGRESAAYVGAEAAGAGAREFMPDSPMAEVLASVAGGMGGSALGSQPTSMGIIKDKGGNWLAGSIEDELARLHAANQGMSGDTPAKMLAEIEERYPLETWDALPQNTREFIEQSIDRFRSRAKIDDWIDTKLNKYIRNEMATEADPIRLQADAFEGQKAERLAQKDAQIARAIDNMERARLERGRTPEEMTRSQEQIRQLQRERALIASQTGLHINPNEVGVNRYNAPRQRAAAGYPEEGLGQSYSGKAWEDSADVSIKAKAAKEILSPSDSLYVEPWLINKIVDKKIEKNPWLLKIPPESKVYEIKDNGGLNNFRGLGFDHMMDELRNATRPDSDLPENLRIDPNYLSKMSVPQIVQKIDEINAYRDVQRIEADALKAFNAATIPHRDYETIPYTNEPNVEGLRWVQIAVPQTLPEGYRVDPGDVGYYRIVDDQGNRSTYGAETEEEAIRMFNQGRENDPLRDALKYEGDAMGHCVGGYCDEVRDGATRIFSLRDARGRPHATVEVQDVVQGISGDILNKIEPGIWNKIIADNGYHDGGYEWLRTNRPDILQKLEARPTQKIEQIKGIRNAAPASQYMPFVQDFVKSGQWSEVGDLQNTGLLTRNRQIVRTPRSLQALSTKEIDQIWDNIDGDYATETDVLNKAKELFPDKFPPEKQGFANGGAVTQSGLVYDADAINALANELMEPVKLAEGGPPRSRLRRAAAAIRGATGSNPVQTEAGSDSLEDLYDHYVSLGYPEGTARKIASGDLPMDTASRMQRAAELGYTEPMYVGTSSGADIREFNPDIGTGARQRTGTWGSADKLNANTYASLPRGQMYQLLMKPSEQAEINAGGRNWSMLPSDSAMTLNDGVKVNLSEAGYTRRNTNDLARLARLYGADSLRVNNVRDMGPYGLFEEDVPEFSDTMVVFKPELLRSKLSAAFDPDEIENRNILAGGSGIGLGLGALLASGEEEREEFNGGGKIRRAASAIRGATTPPREVPDYLSPQEREFLNRDVITGQQVSERVPTGKNYAGDPYDPSLKIGVDVIRQMPEQMRKQADVMANYLNYPENAPRDPESVFRLLGDQGVENLLWLHDQMPEDVRRMSSYWYEGANKMAGEAAQRYGIPIEGTAGVYAALSPQMDWFKNVSLGNRLMDIMSTRQDQMFTPEMRRRGQELVDLPNAGFNPATAVVLDRIKDARLGDLKTPMEKAIWLRVFDEAHNPREYDIVDPMGNVMGLSLTNKGVPARVSWGGLKPIEKGISMFEDPSISNVTRKLGEMHKVRSFYNNIVDPYSGNSVTSDTHNVAAALLRPLSQSNIEVLHNMGSASSTDITGARGTYGFYADAVRRAAQERGLDTPREMQSITWEGVRGLYPPEMKRSALQKQKIDNAFNQYRRGQISGDQLRDMIGQEGGGIRLPAWYAR